LTRHLLEEAYEALDALEAFVRATDGTCLMTRWCITLKKNSAIFSSRVVFHAELGDEEGNFNFASIADGVRDKLIGRHPHVFGDVRVANADEVATRWEVLKQTEKGRESTTDGIVWQLPALTLYTKLLRKAALVDHGRDPATSRDNALSTRSRHSNLTTTPWTWDVVIDVSAAWGDALSALVAAAQFAGVDLEGVLRERAMMLRDAIRDSEATKPPSNVGIKLRRRT
jgi:uncharacterized protein YabN with tetrapyrrole methylase and pyrophosphatase domain